MGECVHKGYDWEWDARGDGEGAARRIDASGAAYLRAEGRYGGEGGRMGRAGEGDDGVNGEWRVAVLVGVWGVLLGCTVSGAWRCWWGRGVSV